LPVHGEISSFISPQRYAQVHPDTQAISLIDFTRDLAFYHIPSPEHPYYEIASPLRTILHVWLTRRHAHIVHSGAVGAARGGVLIVGDNGAGKSTTALACLGSDLHYLGDDRCLVATGPETMIYSLYSSARTNPPDRSRFPFLTPMFEGTNGAGREKMLYMLYPGLAGHLLRGCPLRAVVLPCVTGERDTSLVPAASGEALRVMAPGSVLQWPSVGRDTFQDLALCLRQVPCYTLRVGTDLKRIPGVISTLL
jgi:hypothetical protein